MLSCHAYILSCLYITSWLLCLFCIIIMYVCYHYMVNKDEYIIANLTSPVIIREIIKISKIVRYNWWMCPLWNSIVLAWFVIIHVLSTPPLKSKFLLHDACMSAAYAVVRFLSVTFVHVLCRNSYNGMRIGKRTQAFEWYHFQWPWVTLNDTAKYSMTRSMACHLCDSWASSVFYVTDVQYIVGRRQCSQNISLA